MSEPFFSPLSLLAILWALGSVIVVSATAKKFYQSWQRYSWKENEVADIPFADLPTVSVCIPARNEQYTLAQCLDAVLASDYPKLEIIVLDDASQDATPQLIRSYAQAGVRFIQGEALPEGWLGRNHALQVLSQAASGEYHIYMGVDTRIATNTITKLVHYVHAEHATMVSALPIRERRLLASGLFSTLRYMWQLLLSSRLGQPATSAFWMIHSDTLTAALFEKVKASVLPENTLAQLMSEQRAYRFLISADALGISQMKKWSSQVETGVRQYFPALKNRLIVAIAVILALCLIALVPYGMVILAMVGVSLPFWLLLAAVFAVSTFMTLYGWYGVKILRQPRLLCALLFPFIVLQECFVILASVVAYGRGRVNWKGRNIRSLSD